MVSWTSEGSASTGYGRNHQRRRQEVGGIDSALAAHGLVALGPDVKPLELLEPLYQAVLRGVNRIVALVGTLLQHQPFDEVLALVGDFQRDVGRRRFRALAVGERESEKRLLADVFVGVEVQIEHRVGLALLEIVVADDFIDAELLGSERIGAVLRIESFSTAESAKGLYPKNLGRSTFIL